MKLTLIRHATLILELDGRRLLIDPMLDDPGVRPPIEGTPNPRRNPLVGLPFRATDVVRGINAALVTHLHQDHFDETAARLLPRDVPVFCQPEDDVKLRAAGLEAQAIGTHDWDGLRLARTPGRHGHGAIADRLGPVSGFLLDGVYIAGDTVWCPEASL